MSTILDAVVDELVAAGRSLHGRGWVPATSGNLSARVGPAAFAVTASGVHKGELAPESFLLVDLEGRPADPMRTPSNETRLHAQLYRRDPTIGAVLHVHSLHATVLSRLEPECVALRGWELQKAFAGRRHDRTLELPVFPNEQDIGTLARIVDAALPSELPVGYLIDGHGLYTWGRTVADARRHVEALEFLCEAELLLRRSSR